MTFPCKSEREVHVVGNINKMPQRYHTRLMGVAFKLFYSKYVTVEVCSGDTVETRISIEVIECDAVIINI